jgi:GNAT superfamily N-acetyltransferase
MKLLKTNNINEDFIKLTHKLDTDLHTRYGTQSKEYDTHNKIEYLDTVLIGYLDKKAIACGCFRIVDKNIIEIKRMFVNKRHRGKGYSTELLTSLEAWAKELGYLTIILETGKGQPEAISLYKKCQYKVIDNYGPYKNLPNSICMEKQL